MILDAATLQIAAGSSRGYASLYAQHLADGCLAFGISKPVYLAAFTAQIAHESEGLRYVAELWGPTPTQRRYERDKTVPWPASIAESKLKPFARNRLAFALGNTQAGDGSRYRGHGLIQITGRANHQRSRDRLRAKLGTEAVPDFEAEPYTLSLPQWASWSACDYWDSRAINHLVDTGDFTAVTIAINGGTNGLDDRLARWALAKKAFHVT